MSFQLVSERVHFDGFLYPKCDPRSLVAMDEAMEKAMLNYGSNVCDNDSVSIFKDCPNNELVELLKTKKHARMFVHMLKYIEHKNNVLHNSLCELNLFNYVLALFCAKFACNSTLKNPVFRWE